MTQGRHPPPVSLAEPLKIHTVMQHSIIGLGNLMYAGNGDEWPVEVVGIAPAPSCRDHIVQQARVRQTLNWSILCVRLSRASQAFAESIVLYPSLHSANLRFR